MKLELTNFRCHVQRSYHFPEHEISLLKGEPGYGKTTVFNAIWWVLYGHLRSVGHHMSSTKRTTVKIEFDQLSSLGVGVCIQRQNHPNKFILTIDQPLSGSVSKVSHQGEIAQQLINRVFGSRETWKAVSYIIQGEQCLLLSGSKQDRLRLLEELSFHQDNPKEAINKIDQQLTIEREKFKVMEGTFQKECQRLTQELSKDAIPPNSSIEMRTQLEQELAQHRQQLNQEQEQETERSKLIGLFAHLQNEIKVVKLDQAFQFTQAEINLKLKDTNHRIEEIEKRLEDSRLRIAQFDATEGKDNKRVEEQLKLAHHQKQLYLNNLTLIERDLNRSKGNQVNLRGEIKSIQSELLLINKFLISLEPWIQAEWKRLSPLPENGKWPTLLQLGQISQIERDRQLNSQSAANMNVEYNPSIQSLLTQKENKLRALEEQSLKSSIINKVIILRTKVRELQKELGLTGEFQTVINTDQDARQLQSKLEQIMINKRKILRDKESSLALLFCPKCNQSLSIKDGNLTSDSRFPASPDEIEQLKTYIFKSNQLDKAISTLNASWDGVIINSDQLIDLNKINQPIRELRSKIQNLRQIRWIPSPDMNSRRCRDLITFNTKSEEQRKTIQKKESLHQIIQQKSSLLTGIQGEIDQKETEIEKLNLESILPIDKRILTLEEEKTNYAHKLSTSPIVKMRDQVETLKREIGQTRNEKNKLKGIISKREILTDQLKLKEQKIFQITTNLQKLGQSLLQVITTQIETKNRKLVTVQRGIRLVKWQQRLIVEREQLVNQQGSLADLEELRKIAERVEYQRLIETITSINSTMNLVFGSLFDDEIDVELELFKTLKTKNRTKPQVNCLIHYKGSTYDHTSSISGGEKNRLNLGMILALNLVSSSPLILLDECTCFLNNRLRIQCMESVRQIIGNCKTVICVSHGDNEASYDNVIEVISAARNPAPSIQVPIVFQIKNDPTPDQKLVVLDKS